MRIVVTRPEERAAELVERLEALGHEVAVRPLIAVESLSDEPIELGG
jgi:uroporphyrinogen-III synthase